MTVREIVGDEVNIRGKCGVDELYVRQGLVLDSGVSNLSVAGSLEGGSLTVTGSSYLNNADVTGNLDVGGVLSAPLLSLEHALYPGVLTTHSLTGNVEGDIVYGWGTALSNTGMVTYDSGTKEFTLGAGKWLMIAYPSVYAFGSVYMLGILSTKYEKDGETAAAIAYTSGDKMYREGVMLMDVIDSDGSAKIKILSTVKINTTATVQSQERGRVTFVKLA